MKKVNKNVTINEATMEEQQVADNTQELFEDLKRYSSRFGKEIGEWIDKLSKSDDEQTVEDCYAFLGECVEDMKRRPNKDVKAKADKHKKTLIDSKKLKESAKGAWKILKAILFAVAEVVIKAILTAVIVSIEIVKAVVDGVLCIISVVISTAKRTIATVK